jgi:hypothetical protein
MQPTIAFSSILMHRSLWVLFGFKNLVPLDGMGRKFQGIELSPGNANLLIGVWPCSNREIGVPRAAAMPVVQTML